MHPAIKQIAHCFDFLCMPFDRRRSCVQWRCGRPLPGLGIVGRGAATPHDALRHGEIECQHFQSRGCCVTMPAAAHSLWRLCTPPPPARTRAAHPDMTRAACSHVPANSCKCRHGGPAGRRWRRMPSRSETSTLTSSRCATGFRGSGFRAQCAGTLD